MERTAENDPFTPGFGNLPLVLAGRTEEMGDLSIMLGRVRAGIYEQPRMVTGDRGVGKTALIRELQDEQEEAGCWVVRVAATRGSAVLGRLTAALVAVMKSRDLDARLGARAAAAAQRLAGVEIAGVGVDLHRPAEADPAHELAELLMAAARLAREHDTVLLVLIDEAQGIDLETLGQLFYAVQEATTQVVASTDPTSGARLRQALPIAVVVAGLPHLLSALHAAGSTFGERARRHRLGALSDAEVAEALVALAAHGGAAFDADAAEAVITACGGYPYFLHVIGSAVWRAGHGGVITAQDAGDGITVAGQEIAAFLEERLRTLGRRQREYLKAAADLDSGERTVGRVAAAMGTTSAQLASTTQALVDRHGLLRPDGGHGRLAFTLPGMDTHLRATH